MPSEPHDEADRLLDIVDNAARIAACIAGLNRAAFQADGRMRGAFEHRCVYCRHEPHDQADGRARDAVERCLERVCEAIFRLGARPEH